MSVEWLLIRWPREILTCEVYVANVGNTEFIGISGRPCGGSRFGADDITYAAEMAVLFDRADGTMQTLRNSTDH